MHRLPGTVMIFLLTCLLVVSSSYQALPAALRRRHPSSSAPRPQMKAMLRDGDARQSADSQMS